MNETPAQSICPYIYCRSYYSAEQPSCPMCGYPSDSKQTLDYDFVRASIEALDIGEIIDMHQIIRSVDGVLDMQLRVMRDAGIKRALLQSVSAEFPAIWGNEHLAQLLPAYRDTFWISQYVDPRSTEACGILARCAERGFRVIKLVPCIGYRADDERFDEFWGTMERLNLVAMVHTGFITARHKESERRAGVYFNSRYGNPFYLDRPARKFSSLPIILCHLGGVTWYREAAQMVTEHANVWGDISAFGLYAFERILAERVPIDLSKIFWGNDASVHAYPFNLRLALRALEKNNMTRLKRAVFHDNASLFAERYL